MATTGLLTLLDDISTLLDDVAILTKVATKKTAGLLGDDLALNAQQVSGVKAEREIPVIWSVFKGSALNKLILVPAALLLSVFIPWAINPLLMLGGAFLCFEGFEKIIHTFFYKQEHTEQHRKKIQALINPETNLAKLESKKIKGAIRTDFILSAEIVVIALGTVRNAEFLQQVIVVSVIAAGMTIGVYGLVACIVKLDDAGLYLSKLEDKNKTNHALRALGRALLNFCPYLMKGLSTVGTIAMFLVGGGILLHGIPGTHEILHHLNELTLLNNLPIGILNTVWNGIFGIIIGALLVGTIKGTTKFLPQLRRHSQ